MQKVNDHKCFLLLKQIRRPDDDMSRESHQSSQCFITNKQNSKINKWILYEGVLCRGYEKMKDNR